MTRRSRTALASPGQPDLFSYVAGGALAASNGSIEIEKSRPSIAVENRAPMQAAKPQATTTTAQVPRRHASAPTRVVSLVDLPEYPQLDQDLVDQTIAALPAGKMWFTYQAIRECFGVSRATVARRVKKGLVPGIRFSGNSVVEDGSVRRFDRTQLRWLLLSVRSQHH